MRRVVTVEVAGQVLVGTAHGPAVEQGGRRRTGLPTGLLLLNPGPTPRSGNSDLSAHLADRLARGGLPVYRFDLPGLGDSPGKLPLEINDFWEEVLEGRNDAAALAIVRALRRQHGLGGIILGGLCAGAVTSLRAVEADGEGIVGLLLLEPDFNPFTSGRPRERPPASGLLQRPLDLLKKASSLRRWLYYLNGLKDDRLLGRLLAPFQPWIRSQLTRAVGTALPAGANVSMVLRWERVMARDVPTLLVTTDNSYRYWERVLEAVTTADRRSVIQVRIPNTNHTLTGGQGRSILLDEVGRWTASLGYSVPD
jgi:pimeloyl-ACP methyl ester carboxylesterase